MGSLKYAYLGKYRHTTEGHEVEVFFTPQFTAPSWMQWPCQRICPADYPKPDDSEGVIYRHVPRIGEQSNFDKYPLLIRVEKDFVKLYTPVEED